MIGRVVSQIIFLSLLAESFGFRTTPVVYTRKGPVQGQLHKTLWNNVTYAAFKGIRYAKPPTGHMRFMPPVEADSWKEPLLAFKEGSVCPQFDFIRGDVYVGNEDCLFLNVYTPEIKYGKHMQKKLRSVMVYFYGGTFRAGYGNASLYGPDYFIEEDVVIVTLNYRLGAAGFLSLGHVNASGNAGLKDQVLVLKWVHECIEAFGGDPKNVTIFGQSAGSISVDLHLLSDMSRGYFQSSISMSGAAVSLWGYQSPVVAKERAHTLAKRLGCNTKDDDTIVACLINRKIEDVVHASWNLTVLGLTFLPTVEENENVPENTRFLTECPYTLYSAGKFEKQNHMLGSEKNEVLLFAKFLTDTLIPFDQILDRENEVTAEMPGLALIAEPVKLAVTALRKTLYEGIFGFINILTDILFIKAVDLKRTLMSKHTDYPIYSYTLTFETPYDLHILLYGINVNGSAHGDDFGYIFRNTIVDIPVSPSLPDNIFRHKMVRMWANFAKYGNPTPPGMNDGLLNFVWPDWKEAEEELILDHQPVVKSPGLGIEEPQRLAYGAIINYADCGASIPSVLRNIL